MEEYLINDFKPCVFCHSIVTIRDTWHERAVIDFLK